MQHREPSFVGRSLPDRRAADLLSGQGCFVDDVRLDRPLYVAFLRSPVAAGRIARLDLRAALAGAGIAGVHDGADVARLGKLSVNEVIPLAAASPYPVLAQDWVEAVGQPVAAVLAETSAQAMDGAEAIALEVEETVLPPPRLIAEQSWQAGQVRAGFDRAAFVVDAQISHARLAPSPMEARAIAVAYHPDTDTVTIWHATQTPHRTRSELASILGLDPDRLRVVAPDVGGAFGMKASLYPEEVFAVWAAFRHRRSVKWSATRSEDFLAATHGRGLTSRGRLAVDDTGRFLALEARIEAPLGHWLPNSALIPAWNGARILPGGYDLAHVDIETRAIAVPAAPVGIYRGAGRPEANCLMERLVEKAARATGLDGFAIRARNLLAPSRLPFRTATENVLDSGDYPRALRQMQQSQAHLDAMENRAAVRAEGGLFGVGIAFFLEPSGSGWESATVTLNTDGTVGIASGGSSQGHGRETAFAQIAADTLDVDMDAITVRCGDTGTCPAGIGALASRSTAIGGSAVLEACKALLARRAAGATAPISETVRYTNKGQAWGYGCHMAAVEIDRETGALRVTDYACVDDAGQILNPAQVAGQMRGGVAQGLGEALMEQVVYDADGQLLTGSFMDYAMPRAKDMPPIELADFATPSPCNTLGAKGVGEAGTIGAPAAILNAALDALAPMGITDIDMPLTPFKLWQAIEGAGKDRQ